MLRGAAQAWEFVLCMSCRHRRRVYRNVTEDVAPPYGDVSHRQVVQADSLMLLRDLCNWSLVDERTTSEGGAEVAARLLESKVSDFAVMVVCAVLCCTLLCFGIQQ